MNLHHEGLSLWYGTPDAAAPGSDGVVPRRGASLIVGVHPANPSNAVSVRYRIDGGLVQTVPGLELRTDSPRQVQYFEVRFPAFITGDVVEYAPLFACGGRQVPAPFLAERFPSRFRLAARETPVPPRAPVVLPRAAGQYGASVAFVARVALKLERPQFIGETAAGMRVNFFVREGTLEGEGLHVKLCAHASDHMTVRRDGMGELHIRAAYVADDGASLDVESQGYVDFGPDGYRMAVARRLPDSGSLVVNPLIATRHPKYSWLSRVQCVGVGHIHLDAGEVDYCLYTVTPAHVAAAG